MRVPCTCVFLGLRRRGLHPGPAGILFDGLRESLSLEALSLLCTMAYYMSQAEKQANCFWIGLLLALEPCFLGAIYMQTHSDHV